MEEHTYREWVADYLDKDLSPDDKYQFEKQLETDEKLAAELDFQLDAIAVLQANENALLKAEIQTWWKEDSPPMTVAGRNTSSKPNAAKPKNYWRIAAAFAFCVLIYVVYSQMNNSPQLVSTPTLIAQYLEQPHLLSSNDRSVQSPENTVLRKEAEKAYQNGEFAKSIELFNQIIQTPQADYLDHLYLGLSYLYTSQQTHQALSIVHLQKALTADSDYQQIAQWYLALAYYKADKITESKQLLEEIAADSEGDYQKRAKKLLDSLR